MIHNSVEDGRCLTNCFFKANFKLVNSSDEGNFVTSYHSECIIVYRLMVLACQVKSFS